MRRIGAGALGLVALVAIVPARSWAADECSQLGAASLPQCTAALSANQSTTPEGLKVAREAISDELGGKVDDALLKYERARDLLTTDAKIPAIAVMIASIDQKLKELRSGGKAVDRGGGGPRSETARAAKAEPDSELDPLEPEPRAVRLVLTDGSEIIYSAYIAQPCEVYRDGAPLRSCGSEDQKQVRQLFNERYDAWQSCMWAKGKMKPASLSGELPSGDLRTCRNSQPNSQPERETAQQAQPGGAGSDLAAAVGQSAGQVAGIVPLQTAQGRQPASQQIQPKAGTQVGSLGGVRSNPPRNDFDASSSTISGPGSDATAGKGGGGKTETGKPGPAPQSYVLQPVTAAAAPDVTCVKDPSWTGWIKRTGSDGKELTFFGEERRCEITATGANCDPGQMSYMFVEWSGVLKKQMTRSSPCKSLDQVAANMVDARPANKVSFQMGGDCVRDPDFTSEVTDAFGSSGGLLYNQTTGVCQELSSGKACDEPRKAHMEARWNIKVAAAKAKYPACDAGYRPRSSMPQQAAAPAPSSSGRSLFAQKTSGASVTARKPALKPKPAKVAVARARPPRVRSVATYDDDPAPTYDAPSGGYDGPSAGDVVSGFLSVATAVLPVAAALAGGRVRSTPSYSAPGTTYRPPQTTYPAAPGPSRSGISGSR